MLLALGSSSVFGIDAFGSAFGTLSTAQTLDMGSARIGGGVGIADATSFFGTFSYGMAQYFDGRVKLGMIDSDGADAELVFGVDAKYQIMSVNDATPKAFDMAIGGLFEYTSVSSVDFIQLGAMAVASYPTTLSGGQKLTPYGRLNIRLERWSSGGASDSDIEFGLNGGVAFELNKNLNLYGEFQIDGNDGLFLGIDYRVM
jgi:hypothetical protein